MQGHEKGALARMLVCASSATSLRATHSLSLFHTPASPPSAHTLPLAFTLGRVLQIPPEHGNVLEVNCRLPGYLATGVSGDLTVTFTPKANEVRAELGAGPLLSLLSTV